MKSKIIFKKMEQILQYKGIFYNNKTTHHYYEGGAHFSYYALVKALSELKQDLNKERKNISQESSSSSSKEKIKKKMKEIKKINMPLLSKQKNQSMECIIDNNKKQLLDDIYNKIIKVTENCKEENRALQKNLESEILYYKGLNETSLSKIYAADKIIKLNETQHNIILKLEDKIDELKTENNDKMNRLQLDHERHYLKLKKQMH